MSYSRVVPRDLFNEANFLKCLGQLCLKLDNPSAKAEFVFNDGPFGTKHFEIDQCQADGSLRIANVFVRVDGQIINLYRPLNSRAAWPLWAHTPGDDDMLIFNEDGKLTEEAQVLFGVGE